ncbi:MAG: hypothetical protein AB8H79_02020 [Myxococcota bacterium]
MHAAIRHVAPPPTRVDVLHALGAALRPFGGWPWGRDLAWASDQRAEFLRGQVLRRDLEQRVLPQIRLFLSAASPAQRDRLAEGVVGLTRRCQSGLPAFGRESDAMVLLAGVRHPDPCDRLLAWLVSQVCGGSDEATPRVDCTFFRAVRQALLDTEASAEGSRSVASL